MKRIVDWVGEDFDGVIAFDESHAMGNNRPIKGKRGSVNASMVALAGKALSEALLYWSGDNLKVGEGTPAFGECVSGLPQFALLGRDDERLERFKPVTGSVVEILLAKHAAGAVPYLWERFLGIGKLLGELAGRLPERRPGSRARSRQDTCRERNVPESPCFVQLAATRLTEGKHGIDGRRRERGLDRADVLGEPLNAPGAKDELPAKLLGIVRLQVEKRPLKERKTLLFLRREARQPPHRLRLREDIDVSQQFRDGCAIRDFLPNVREFVGNSARLSVPSYRGGLSMA